MPNTYVFSKNGMGNYVSGTGMREDMLMQMFNIFLVAAGVVDSGDFVVTETTVPSMNVKVTAGRCFVQNTSYVINTANSTKFWGVLAEEFELAVATNTSGSTRVDLVVVKINTAASPNDYATNVATVEIVQGTPGAGAPATPSNALKICEITIPTGTTTSITTGMVGDSRVFVQLNEDYVSGEITEVSATLTADGGSPALGTGGTLICRYNKRGRVVTAWYELILGTGFSLGTGGIYFSLPFNASADMLQSIYDIYLEDVGTQVYYGRGVIAPGATKTDALRVENVSATYPTRASASATVPFTAVAGDKYFTGPIIYETDD